MNTRMYTEEEVASGYPPVIVLVNPDPGTYYPGVDCRTDTNDTTPEIIFDDIMRKYHSAWEKLAKL
ncbi:hypothetical protein ISS37_07785 [candidate division KSB1 bacterium]|nr:hypothetical protein [candidate division KSB1 bacterium]